MSERVLVEIAKAAKWGDLILIRCNAPKDAAIRLVCRSYWDHFGVVVDDGIGGRSLLEACGAGVCTFPLEARLREYITYFAEEVGWQQLRAPRTSEACSGMHTFVAAVDGQCGYSYDVGKVFFSWLPFAGGAPSIQRDYICTELIAALWQACGYLEGGCNPASFWPGDMLAGGSLGRHFVAGVSLGPLTSTSSGSSRQRASAILKAETVSTTRLVHADS